MMDPETVAKDIIGKSFEAVKEKYEPFGYRFYVVENTNFIEDVMQIYYNHTFDVIVNNGLIESIFKYNKPTDLEIFGGIDDW